MLMAVVDKVNKRFGRDNLMFGRVHHDAVWRVNTAYLSPNYTTKWSDLKSVKA